MDPLSILNSVISLAKQITDRAKATSQIDKNLIHLRGRVDATVGILLPLSNDYNFSRLDKNVQATLAQTLKNFNAVFYI